MNIMHVTTKWQYLKVDRNIIASSLVDTDFDSHATMLGIDKKGVLHIFYIGANGYTDPHGEPCEYLSVAIAPDKYNGVPVTQRLIRALKRLEGDLPKTEAL